MHIRIHIYIYIYICCTYVLDKSAAYHDSFGTEDQSTLDDTLEITNCVEHIHNWCTIYFGLWRRLLDKNNSRKKRRVRARRAGAELESKRAMPLRRQHDHDHEN